MTAQQEKKKKTEYDKALAAYDQALKLFQKRDYEKAKESLGAFEKEFHKERELVDRARMHLQICDNYLNPPKVTLKTLDDYFQNGIGLINQGQYADALTSLETALSKDPKNARVLYTMADVSCLKKDHKACLEYLKQAVALDQSLATLARNERDFEPLKENEGFLEITVKR